MAIVVVAGCSKLGTLNTLLPKDNATREVVKHVAYGSDPRQQLDIYLPQSSDAESKNSPVVVFFYGGSWSSGKKKEYSFVGRALNAKGIIAVIADYRLVPKVRYPDFVFDSAKAVTWVAENISNHGGDANNLFVAGHSAGAYNAMMIALADFVYTDQGEEVPAIAGMIGLAGPYDFSPKKWPETRAAFKGTSELDATQPINYLTSESPPLLLMTGVDDIRVDPQHSKTMNKLAAERGAEVEFHLYDDIGHAKLLLSLAKPFRDWAPTLEHIDAFITRYGE